MVQSQDPTSSSSSAREQDRCKLGLDGVTEAPCYFPTMEEFEEPLKFIASIRVEAERYGICRICPPPGWKPPFVHKPDKLRFLTKEQDLGKLAGSQRLTGRFTENLRKFLFLIGKPMESAFGGKVCIGNHGGGPVDMFRLFKEVQRVGGNEEASRKQSWGEVARLVGCPNMGKAVQRTYMRYLSDFEAAHSGKGLGSGREYSPIVYQEKASVEADLRLGVTLWHFLEEERGAGRCYYGTLKTLRSSQGTVEYDRAERLPEPQRRGGGQCGQTVDGPGGRGKGSGGGGNGRSNGGWAGGHHASVEVEPFRVTLPRTQLSTLVLNGKSPAAAKLAAHGVVCEVCSIAAASKAVLAVCASCDSAYHLNCVEPALLRVPFHDWFCGDCAKDGNTMEALARGGSQLFSVAQLFSSSHNNSKTASKNASKSSPTAKTMGKSAMADDRDDVVVLETKPATKSAPNGGEVAGVSKLTMPGVKQEGSAKPGRGTTEMSAGIGSQGAAVAEDTKPPTLPPSTPPRNSQAVIESIAVARPRRARKPTAISDQSYPSDFDDEGNEDCDVAIKEEADDSQEGSGTESDEENDELAERRSGSRRGAKGGRGGRGAGGRRDVSDRSAEGKPASSRMRGVSGMGDRALKYGFSNGGQYTLKEFALMADGWRSNYLARRGLGDDATEYEMESEFWKLVGPDPPEDNVKVLYGSDLDTASVGSGFPWTRTNVNGVGGVGAANATAAAASRLAASEQGIPATKRLKRVKEPPDYQTHSYGEDAWNLNCLPTSDGSLLQFLGKNIQGVMVPWLYVGMAFSAFCWHNEDHYLYSINYLHAGSPKRWYGVPGAMADKFELAVRLMFPELFEVQPDLLMQLVTMAHPSEVVKRGVTVSSTTQREGEFVLTFPQAYHAGFNMGTNCAEAVNFAPPDWLPWGKAAQDLYRDFHRKPVFSHEGLVLSLVDLLSKQTREGIHTSGDLYSILRDEVEGLAVDQQEGIEMARQLGCTRFEPIEKLAERLRGWGHVSGSSDGPTSTKGVARTKSAGLSSRRSCNSGNSNSCYTTTYSVGGSTTEQSTILSGLESASPVSGPQCSTCYQYCFLEVVVCDSCDGGGRGGGTVVGDGNAGVGGGVLLSGRRRPVRRRKFACGRHMVKLCACSASEYTYYVRKDPGELRAAARGLSSLEEQLDVWEEEANRVVDVAAGITRGRSANAAGKDGGVVVKEEVTSGMSPMQMPSIKENYGERSKSTPSPVGTIKVEGPTHGSCGSTAPSVSAPAFSKSTASAGHASLIPPRWHQRPTVSYLRKTIRAGEELGGSEELLADLQVLVESCGRWMKVVDNLLGSTVSPSSRERNSSPVGTGLGRGRRTGNAAVRGGEVSANGGVSGTEGPGLGSSGKVKSRPSKPRDPAAFHKAVALLQKEAVLPGRPVESTERLCSALLASCRLREQVRSLLGLSEDEDVTYTTVFCHAVREAEKEAASFEQKSGSRPSAVKPVSGSSSPAPGLDENGNASNSNSGDSVIESGDTEVVDLPAPGGGAAGPSAFSPLATAEADTDQSAQMGGGGTSSVGSARTRTRTNVALPTGTLAAERGTWRALPWRLWPVHQANAAALLEACTASAVEVPEISPLRQALAALANRGGQVKVEPSMASGPGAPVGSAVAGGQGNRRVSTGSISSRGRRGFERVEVMSKKSLAASAGGTRGRAAETLGPRTRLSCSPPPTSPKGMGGAGAVLVGAAHKRRRQDAVAATGFSH